MYREQSAIMLKRFEESGGMFNRDLAGYKLGWIHFLELDRLIERFPVIIESGEIVAVRDKKLLEKVWGRMEPRPAGVTSILLIASATEGIAFSLDEGADHIKALPLRIMTEDDIDLLCCRTISPFRWAHDPCGKSEHLVQDPDFS